MVGASTSAIKTSTSLSVSSMRSSASEPTGISSTLSESVTTPTSTVTTNPTMATNQADSTQSIRIGAGVGGAVGLFVLMAIIFISSEGEYAKKECHVSRKKD